MRNLLACLLVCLLASSSPAGVDLTNAGVNATAMLTGTSNSNISPQFPMTVLIWAKGTTTTGILISSGETSASGGGWGLSYYDCGASHSLGFTKYRVVGICSTVAVTTGTWEAYAVVVTSTNVHFYKRTLAGVVTTQDVADSAGFNTGGSRTVIGGVRQLTNFGQSLGGSVSWAAIWPSSQLSDDELNAAAVHGPFALGRPVHFWPLYWQNDGSLATGTFLDSNSSPIPVSPVNAAVGKDIDCPCGNPWQLH